MLNLIVKLLQEQLIITVNNYSIILSNILLIFRGDEKFVVNSKTTLEKNDTVYFVVDNH